MNDKPTKVAIAIDAFFLLMAGGMIVWIVILVSKADQSTPQWLLVPLNILYVIVSLYIAAASFRNAAAANRAAQAMEESVVEARISRFAQFAPLISPADTHPLTINPDGTAELRLKNPFGQPARELRAYLFEARAGGQGKPEFQLSTMRESTSRDVPENETAFTLHLSPSNSPDADRRDILNVLIEQMQRYRQTAPESFLLGLFYHYKGDLTPVIFTFDVTPVPQSEHTSS